MPVKKNITTEISDDSFYKSVPVEEKTEMETVVVKRQRKDDNIIIKVSPDEKKQIKAFFAERGLTISRGIDVAVHYLMTEVKRKNINLNEYGIEKNL